MKMLNFFEVMTLPSCKIFDIRTLKLKYLLFLVVCIRRKFFGVLYQIIATDITRLICNIFLQISILIYVNNDKITYLLLMKMYVLKLGYANS